MFTYEFVDANVRLALVVEPFEVFDLIVEKLHVPVVDCVLNLAVGEDEVDALRLEEIERPRILLLLYTLHIL